MEVGRMRLKYKLLFIFLVFWFVLETRSQDDNEIDDDDPPKSCDTYAFLWIKGIVKSLLKCLSGRSTFRLKNIFELGTRASCLLKCTLQEEGTIGMDGYLDDIGAAMYFEDSFDTPVKDISMPELQACFALARQFNPKEYWCKTYLPFVECSLSAILKGFIPYVGDCISSPILGILFSGIKYLAPESPTLTRSMTDLRRSMQKKNQFRCLDKNCTRLYEYKKVNGTKALVLYNKNLEVVSVETKKGQGQRQKMGNDRQNYKPRRWWQRQQQPSRNNGYNYRYG